MTETPFDIQEIFTEQNEKARAELGHVNVLIAGRTGVGKSTLVNAVFQGHLARTGQGRPVTQHIREISKKGVPLTIIDTRGIEMRDFEETYGQLEALIESRNRETDPHRHIHIAWICIQEPGRRVEDAEIALHERLARHMPVIGVITKATSDMGFAQEVRKLLPKARDIVRVHALETRLDDGHVIPPKGLEKLVEVTLEYVPEGHRRAFVAAQKASLEQKVRLARTFVAAAASAAAVAGATPIPFSDAMVLVPIQVGMLAKITSVFGLELSGAFLASLVASFAGTSAATLAGRALVSNLLKLIPGVGTIAGGAISGATAATLTTTLGETYIRVLASLFERSGGEPPGRDEIVGMLEAELS